MWDYMYSQRLGLSGETTCILRDLVAVVRLHIFREVWSLMWDCMYSQRFGLSGETACIQRFGLSGETACIHRLGLSGETACIHRGLVSHVRLHVLRGLVSNVRLHVFTEVWSLRWDCMYSQRFYFFICECMHSYQGGLISNETACIDRCLVSQLLSEFQRLGVSDETACINEPCCEKTGLQGFRTGPTQTGLHNHWIWLEAYREADLRLCFHICKKLVFSRRGSNRDSFQ